MKVHRKLIVAYVLTGLFPMCLMFTLFYTQMRRVLVEREIKNLQTTFDQAVDDVNTELALHQSMSDYLAFDQTIVQIVKAEDKNSFEAYERMVKEFDPMMDSLSYFTRKSDSLRSMCVISSFRTARICVRRGKWKMMNGQHRQTMMFTGMPIWIRER